MALTLIPKQPITIPLELRGLLPTALESLDRDQICGWPLPSGRQQVALGELFDVVGDARDGTLILDGPLPVASGLGESLASGEIRVKGSVGGSAGVWDAGGPHCRRG